MHTRHAYRVYLLTAFAEALFSGMYFTVSTIYRVEVAGLNPLQLVLVGTIMEASIFIFEIPTGVVADVFSRRLSIIIGWMVMGGGLVLEALVPRFGVILVAQALWGFGYTFTSGATEAWIAGEVGEAATGNAFVRGSQAGTIGGFLAVFASVALASLRLNLPMLLAGLFTVGMGAALLVIMPETGFRPTPRAERSSWGQMGDTLRAGVRLVRVRPALLTILGIGLFFGLYSEGYDRLADAHFLVDLRFPSLAGLSGQRNQVVWFGVMALASMPLTLAATELVRRRVNLASHRGIAGALSVLTALLSASVIAFGLAGNFALAVLLVWCVAVLRTTSSPLYTAWIAQHTDPRVRATVISLSGQVDAIGQVIGGPAVGYIGMVRGLRTALVVTGALLAPALLLFARTLRRDGDVMIAAGSEADGEGAALPVSATTP